MNFQLIIIRLLVATPKFARRNIICISTVCLLIRNFNLGHKILSREVNGEKIPFLRVN